MKDLTEMRCNQFQQGRMGVIRGPESAWSPPLPVETTMLSWDLRVEGRGTHMACS
jgi:hypothetical protein